MPTGHTISVQPNKLASAAITLCFFHAALLVGVGAAGSLFLFWPGPEALTSLMLIILVPLSLIRQWPGIRSVGFVQAIRERDGKLFLVLILVSALYAVSPGFLACWPLQALGFRLAYGRQLESWSHGILADTRFPLHFAIQPAPFTTKSGSATEIHVPIPLEIGWIGHDILVDGAGVDRHITFRTGGGFGGYELFVGGPAYTRTDGSQLWNGVYFLPLSSSEGFE